MPEGPAKPLVFQHEPQVEPEPEPEPSIAGVSTGLAWLGSLKSGVLIMH